MSYLKYVVPFLLIAACGGDDAGKTPADAKAPTVSSTVPLEAAAAVAINLPVTATFDREMDPSTIDASSFFLKQGTTVIAGAVSYLGKTATLTPSTLFAPSTELTATLTTDIKDEAGVALAKEHSWTFTTVAVDALPEVAATLPLDEAVGVWIGQPISVTFNMPMDAETLTATSFTVRQGEELVAGEVAYEASANTAIFRPADRLGASLLHTVTISTDAASATGRKLEADHSFRFTTAAAPELALPVDLGTAGNYAILAQTAISAVPPSVITGDIAVSPAAESFITGFSLTADATNVFATSPQVVGKVFAADQAAPTPADLTAAVSDMGNAFTDAAGRAPDVTELGAGDIGGMTLPAGVYKWGSGLLIPTDVRLVGNATDVWIFQIAGNLTVSSATSVMLSGGALPKNIFWQVAGNVDLNTTAHFEGIVLSQTAITLRTGASVNGRLLAQSAVAIDASTVVAPAL